MTTLQQIKNVPFGISVLKSIYPDCEFITDKARRMVENKEIIRLKNGLYVANVNDGTLSKELIANHIYGPSYVSVCWALRRYGLIPERVHLVESMTLKHSRNFKNDLASFYYYNCPEKYFPIGINIKKENDICFLIATPEKALCDYVIRNKVKLRSIRETGAFLEEDLRFDMDEIGDLNLEIIEKCATESTKKDTLLMLLKFLKNEQRV